ncbi:TetR/AcrR family transcriptional regulator [Novosphingobium clariflavum]|uniref:TetR/AcrR family transcriptional regulator n=1 Tax=Novosphingobium clariflavum TaxID=2029884 RepID=A0ABV6S916_9SPHN|nr:TetR/AcrR family transcriptional regulator [Novosphingobium clariflavum]
MVQTIEKRRGASIDGHAVRRRNKGFEETHLALIETAVRLVSEKGLEALSLSEVARVAGVNRTTIYYHFASREALIEEVREWSAEQLGRAFASSQSAEERARYITRFVLENPDVVALWTEEFLSPGRIADRYPAFDAMAAGFERHFTTDPRNEGMDGQVFATFLLAWAMLGPRIYRNSVRPDVSIDETVERLTRTHMAILQQSGIVDM